MQEPSSGRKRNSAGRVKHHIPRAEGRVSLVVVGSPRSTTRSPVTNAESAGLQGAVRPGVLLFPLGSSVLEPDFNLGLGQTQG